jgi:hypothetical protein
MVKLKPAPVTLTGRKKRKVKEREKTEKPPKVFTCIAYTYEAYLRGFKNGVRSPTRQTAMYAYHVDPAIREAHELGHADGRAAFKLAIAQAAEMFGRPSYHANKGKGEIK